MAHFVKLRWEPRDSPFGGRRARFSYDYDAYVPDRVGKLELALPGDVAAAVSAAERGLALADGGPSFAGFETLSRHLLRAESVASSRVEGLIISHRRLAEAAAAPGISDDAARSVLGNIAAMERAIAIGSRPRPLRREDLIEIHRVLLGATRDAHLGGVVRREQNWIGGRSDGPRGAEFVPPPAKLVRGLLDDLVAFCNRTDLPPVAQAAVAHAQFETIHPFSDGNGRVGRCLIHVLLRRHGAAPRLVPPVSIVLASDAAAYVAGLGDFRRGDVAGWIGAFAAATSRSLELARDFGERVDGAVARWRAEVRARRGSLAERTAAVLPDKPILDTARLAAELNCSPAAANGVLTRFAAAGILSRSSLGRRNRVWVARGVFHLLDEFERGALQSPGRRARVRSPARQPTRMPGPEVSALARRVLELVASGVTTLADLDEALAGAAAPRRIRVSLYGLRDLGLVRLAGRARTARWSATAAGRDALGADQPPG